jgi:hypothetical protein
MAPNKCPKIFVNSS